jgi:hypothetical protein
MREVFVAAAALLAQFAGATSSNAACDPKLAKPIADKVSNEIAIMIQFTKATCFPSDDGGKCSLLCASDLRISGMNRNIVLTFITASAGKKMRLLELGGSPASCLPISICWKKGEPSNSPPTARPLAATTEKPEVMAARVGNEYSEIDFSKK